jgi:hypothetical protein
MQPQMSPAPGDRPAPARVPAPLPKPGPSRRGLWGLLLVAAALAGGVLLYQRSKPAEKTGGPTAVLTRTATVAVAPTMERTLRLSGSTAAENSAALVSPQLRGSRGGFGRENQGGAGGASTSPTIQSKQGGNTSPSASSGNTSNMSDSL